MTHDIMTRGGMERFHKDHTVDYKPAPWWEPIYAMSYISRLILGFAGYNETLRNYRITPQEKKNADDITRDLFEKYLALCREKKIRLIIVLHPQEYEVQENKYSYDFSDVLRDLRSKPDVLIVDLLPAYRSYLSKTHTQAKDYYWIEDGHHNSRGYKMMAETTLKSILPLLIDSSYRH
jgi:hypothetical protein